MEYIHRSLERKFLKMSSSFKVVMLTGARQVGKSTMLKHLAKDSGRVYVSMDDLNLRELAQRDPKLFFQIYQPPILIDEVQKAPALFEEIKLLCDESDERGRFWLTGSQSKRLMRQAGDSLAGRICILKMFSLSAKELAGKADDIPDNYTFSSFLQRSKNYPENNILQVYDRIWKGGMPDNYNDLGNAAGVSAVTAKEWIKVLQSMGIIFLLEPFYNNELKRMIKTPKLYFCDTGLCSFLSSWTSRDTLMNGAASGHYLENYVVSEILKNTSYGEKTVSLNFYRDTNQKEIDLVLEIEGGLYAFEIKRTASPERKLIRTFSLLEKSGKELKAGGIICMAEKPFPMDSSNFLLPVNLL